MAGSEPLILVTGGRGQGKSCYTKKRIKKAQRVVVLDVMREYDKEPGFSLATTIEQVAKLQRAATYKIAFQPSTGNRSWSEWNHYLSKYLIAYQDAYKDKGKRPKPICYVVEEMSASAPNEKQVKELRGFDEMIDRGRHVEISVIGVTQRVTKAKKDFVEQAEEKIIFRIGSRDAAMIEREYLPPSWGGEIAKQAPHHFIQIAGLEVSRGKNILR